MKVCRICLSDEGRLYALKKQLKSLYDQLTGLDNTKKKLPPWVCAECGLRLMSYDKLRQKSLQSHELLSQMFNKSKNITKKHLQQIKSHCREPRLSFSNINLVVYNPKEDVSIDNLKEQHPTIDNSDTLELLTPKEEEEDLLDENIEVKSDTENTQETFTYELKYDINKGIEAEYGDVDYLDDEDSQEIQSKASNKSDHNYLASDSSSKPPSTKKPSLKKMPVKSLKEKKVVKHPVHKEQKEDLLDENLEVKSDTKNTQETFTYELKYDINKGIEAEYGDIDYLDDEDSQEIQSKASNKSDPNYLVSDSSSKPPSTIKHRLKKLPVISLKEKKMAKQPVHKEQKEDLLDETLEVKSDTENTQETFTYELKYDINNLGIGEEYGDVDYLEDEDSQEIQSKASIKRNQNYLASDSSSKPPSTKKPRLKKLPVKSLKEKKITKQPVHKELKEDLLVENNEMFVTENSQETYSFDIDSLDIEEEYCDIEYLDDVETQESQENASNKSDQDYLPSDDSSGKPIKKAKSIKLPAKSEEKKVETQTVEVELQKSFTITRLSLNEQIEDLERRKDMPEYAAANFKCDFCFKWYTGKEAYDDHMVKHSEISGNFECRVCRARFKSPYVLKNHMRRTHGYTFKCNACDFVSTVRSSAVRHGKLHTGALYLCPYCVHQFNDVTVYWRHMRVRHSTCSHVCALCGHGFLSDKGLMLHWIAKHPGLDSAMTVEGPRCETCNVTFASKEAYDTHIRVSVKHKGEGTKRKHKKNERRIHRKPNPCEECGLQMNNFKAYINHFRRMHPHKTRTQYFSPKAAPCMCELCGQLVQHSSALGDHMISNHGPEKMRIYKCSECPKTFSQALYLVKHCKKAHNKLIEVPSDASANSWPCPQCSKILSSKASLRVHKRLHDVNRMGRYPCDQCGKAFYNHCRLRRHMVIHLGKDRFKCNECQEGFYSKGELSNHIASSHSKV